MLKDPYIRQHFGGVLAVNEVPVLLTPDKIYIVNTDPSDKPGRHWFVLYKSSRFPEHFDPAGLQPVKDIHNVLVLNGPRYIYNTQRIQHYNSDTCGLFCLFFCYFRCRGYSFVDILNMFYKNLFLNEIIVIQFYECTK